MNDEIAEGEDIESNNNTQFEASKLVTGIIHKKKASNLISTDQKLSELGEKKPLKNKIMMDPVTHTNNKEEQPVCRICLMEDNEIDNPLFSPCKCSGSMRFIHHECLKTWFASKRIMK